MLIFFTVSCKKSLHVVDGVQIAFLSDVHLSDIYGNFEDSDYKGVVNPKTDEYVLIRTMESQLHSTRLFNENYFAFLTALEDIAKRNIKLVVLPGDFSDDGQPYNLRGLEKVLQEYRDNYGIHFFIISGNHDPVMPFTIESGKRDFLGNNGQNQAVFSDCVAVNVGIESENNVVITKDIRKLGYSDISNIMYKNGIMPQKDYLYWSTPFSTYSYENYSFAKASLESNLDFRKYSVGNGEIFLPDISYLVEPLDDLWFLALDGNVYLSSAEGDMEKAPLLDGGEYSNIIKYKEHLTSWVRYVTSEAERLNKTLITFSHYPVVDFHEDATSSLKSLFGTNKMQLFRVPDDSIASLFADLGVKIHFAGHLHLNDTGARYFNDGNFIVNIQIPSLAGYPSAYKVLTVSKEQFFEVETVMLDSVPRFNELFSLYEKEYSYLQSSGNHKIWDKGILETKSYKEFVNFHLRELVRLRFIPNDWPLELKDFLLNHNGLEILHTSGGLTVDSLSYSDWDGFDMIVDFYKLINGDQLAITDIGAVRISQYRTIIDLALRNADNHRPEFILFLKSFKSMLDDAEPSIHFRIDLRNGAITDISNFAN